MLIYKNDERRELRIECVSKRQYKAIKWPFKLHKIHRKADIVYNDKSFVIELICNDEETYAQVFEGMNIQRAQAHKKGLKVPRVVINDMD